MSSIGDGVHDDLCPYMPEPYEECQCHLIKAAYRRGREDAAKAVEQLRIGSFGIAFNGKFYESVLDTKEAIAAARGDGEQA